MNVEIFTPCHSIVDCHVSFRKFNSHNNHLKIYIYAYSLVDEIMHLMNNTNFYTN